MSHVRESILQAAAISVEELLGLSGYQRITATLLDFSGRTFDKMRIVARSSRERKVGIEYDSERLATWAAIRDGRIVVVDDISNDPRWADAQGKGYMTVAAIPVSSGGRAFGAISFDYNLAYGFLGHADDIAIQAEPYLAVLALTYPEQATYKECKYAPSHG